MLPCHCAWVEQNTWKIDSHVRELLSWVGLGERLDARPSTLSGGQQQRVAIARAVINRPRLLLADEPTGNVDDRIAVRLMYLFEELNKTGTTVVIATHNNALVEKFGHPILRLDDGELSVRPQARYQGNELVFSRHSDLPFERDQSTRFLPWIVALMVFLGALMFAAALVVSDAVDTWDSSLTGRMTIQIPENETPGDTIPKLTEALQTVKDITSVRIVPDAEARALLIPWLAKVWWNPVFRSRL